MSLITKLVGFLVLAVALNLSATTSAQKGTIQRPNSTPTGELGSSGLNLGQGHSPDEVT